MTQRVSVLWIAVSLASSVAWAQSYEEAQAELAAAYSDYYRALRSKPGFTQEDASRLASEILAPVNAKVAKAMEEDSRKTRGSESAASAVVESVPVGRNPAGSQILPREPREVKEEVVLDGSGVPKEVEFPGEKKAKP